MPKVRRNAEQGRQSPHGGALQHHSSTKTLPKHLPSHPDSVIISYQFKPNWNK